MPCFAGWLKSAHVNPCHESSALGLERRGREPHHDRRHSLQPGHATGREESPTHGEGSTTYLEGPRPAHEAQGLGLRRRGREREEVRVFKSEWTKEDAEQAMAVFKL